MNQWLRWVSVLYNKLVLRYSSIIQQSGTYSRSLSLSLKHLVSIHSCIHSLLTFTRNTKISLLEYSIVRFILFLFIRLAVDKTVISPQVLTKTPLIQKMHSILANCVQLGNKVYIHLNISNEVFSCEVQSIDVDRFLEFLSSFHLLLQQLFYKCGIFPFKFSIYLHSLTPSHHPSTLSQPHTPLPSLTPPHQKLLCYRKLTK